MRQTGDYPSSRTDGTEVYFDVGTSVQDTGLSPDTTYYYRAWSYVTGSVQWSDTYAQDSATTGETVTTVVIDPAAKTVGQGEQFTLDVLVTPDTDIAGVQCDISFDSSLITADGVAEGNLLNQGGASTYFSAGTIDNIAGTITGIAGAITTPGETVSAQGVFATVTFTADAVNGDTPITLSDVIVGDAGGIEVDVGVTGGSVTVGPVGPPTVTTDAASSVEETEATLNGTIDDDGGEACEYRFEYDTDSGEPYTYSTTWTDSKTTGQSFSEAISGLSRGTVYYFRAQAKNSAGTGSGSEQTFLTKPDAPANFNAAAVNTTQIDLTWVKGDGAQKTMIRRSDVDYPGAYDGGDEAYFDTGTGTSDTGLTPGTTYYYSAWSFVEGSEQWSDNHVQASAATAAGTPTVTTDAATLVEETEATLNGTLDDDGGEACQYRFEYDTDSGAPYAYNTTWTGSKTTGQSFSEAISGLAQGTTYYFRAQAKNGVGTGSGSEETFLTKPDAPTGFNATAFNATRIDLSWTKGVGAEKTKIIMKIGSYPADRTDGTEVYFDTGNSTADMGLLAGTTYYYSAWSYVVGSEQWSDSCAQASATTPGDGLIGDVNGDGYVNVQDLVLIGQHWGETGTPGWIPEDVKADGVINVQDMVVVGQHWTG